MKIIYSLSIAAIVIACTPEIKKENQKLVESIDYKVKSIDHHHRITIVEDDFVQGDSTFKVRAYMSEGRIQKLVGITRTAHFERDDYFYFENEKPIFSGHMINFVDESLAEEFKYYYRGNNIVESLFWEDHYDPTKRFPHEHFEEFEPNMDSLMAEENSRLAFFRSKLDEEGFAVKEENDNLNN
ncbi:MAG: hypothetical protein ABJP45_12995 [Cyclobacteriaceae bacterium]